MQRIEIFSLSIACGCALPCRGKTPLDEIMDRSAYTIELGIVGQLQMLDYRIFEVTVT